MSEMVYNIYPVLSQPYAVLLLALALDLSIGDPAWLPHPVRIIGGAITRTETFLRTEDRRHKTGERFKGILLVLIIVGSTFLITWLIVYTLSSLVTRYSLLVTVILVYLTFTTIAVKGLADAVKAVTFALRGKDIDTARAGLSSIVGRDTHSLDEKGILRAAIESLAENASDGVIAPIFYFTIGGFPLAMTYKAINTLDSMVGYKNEKYRHFGWAAARLDDLANYIPARITGILIVVASFIVCHSLSTVHNSLKIMFRDGRKHPSPNSGFPEAAMAGALGIRLGGPSKYNGISIEKPYIGEETNENYLLLSKNAVQIVKAASLLGAGIACIILYLRGLGG